jgi:hypothetical protein
VHSCRLYELEDTLQALANSNSIALAEDENARQTTLDEIGQALGKTKDERDAVVALARHCELQQKFADTEIDRIAPICERCLQARDPDDAGLRVGGVAHLRGFGGPKDFEAWVEKAEYRPDKKTIAGS